MSKIAVSSNASGTGTFTIASPNSNTDRTLTLPDETGTVVSTASTPTFTGAVTAPAFIPNGSTVPTNGTFLPASNTLAWSTGSTERMRIDSSGNVGIGTSSPNTVSARTVLTVASASSGGGEIDLTAGGTTALRILTDGSYNTEFINPQNAPLIFSTNGTERARITSGGKFCIGTTTATTGSVLRVQGSDSSDNTYNTYIDNSSGTLLLSIINDGDFRTGTATHSPYNYTTSNAANLYVASDGLLQRSTSSLKYKTDIQDAMHGLSDLLKLRSVTYKSKSEKDKKTVFGGLIAEEVDAVGLTEFVQYADDGTPDALAYGNMVSLCIKAIQELNAKVETLEAQNAAFESRLAALEATK